MEWVRPFCCALSCALLNSAAKFGDIWHKISSWGWIRARGTVRLVGMSIQPWIVSTCLLAAYLVAIPATSAEPSNLAATKTTALRYLGMCDASGAVAIGSDAYVVANDEDNRLRFFSNQRGGAALQTFDLTPYLRIQSVGDEADLEAAAAMGKYVYWMASHGRSGSGKIKSDRHKFIATRVTRRGKRFEVKVVGRAYGRLILDMLADRRLGGVGLAQATQFTQKAVRRLAPKAEGLNIEGLAAGADGKSLLIAFRNPRPGGKALLVPLTNPEAVVTRGVKGKFGPPILLDLGGLGVRSIAYSAPHGGYLIVAGRHDTQRDFVLYRWSGKSTDAAIRLLKIKSPRFGPEALVVFPGRDDLFLLSDDGTLKVGGIECKSADVANRSFVGRWFKVPVQP